MFKKEAEKYRLDLIQGWIDQIRQGYNCKESSDIVLAFLRGADCGYGKANEWCYPSKGEYPRENKRYLCKIKAFVGGGITYECFDYDTEYNSWKGACGDILAWKDIIPPKE